MILAIIQARMGSTRMPGKTLANICGHPMLWHVTKRVGQARLIDQIVIATTLKAADDPIAEFCERESIFCFRGNEDDVLDRYYHAAEKHSAETVVRVTSDCPLIDPEVIDKVIGRFVEGDLDYVSNTFRYTYPDGLDTEVFSFQALERAWREASKPSEREHVTPYLYSGRFRTANVENDDPVRVEDYRWTVDYPDDLRFVRWIFSAMNGTQNFGYREIIDLLEKRPEMASVQAKTISNEGYYRSLYRQAVTGVVTPRPLVESQTWLARSQKVIPGCAQTFSKGYTQYVQGVAPIFLQRGRGCRAWDVDGNEYIDYVQGLLPNILGYADDRVNRAVSAQIADGHSFSLPHPLEVQLAERLTKIFPCAEMVRFGKNGSDATSGAVRAARAFTGRERIACCGYHGWQDWYIGSTTRNAGVPVAVRDLTHPFRYNDLPGLVKLLEEHHGEFAAIIMEPFSFEEPATGFLQGVKELAHKQGALLIFDEICSGFHFGLGGAQKLFGVTPDMACFGKAMGNGFPISCIAGRSDVMKIFEEIFFSFTFAGEVASMAASMAVLDVLEQTDALARLESNGRVLRDGSNAMTAEAGLSARIQVIGRPQWTAIKFKEADGADSPLLKNLFQQEAIKRGVLLLVTHNLTAAHDETAIHQTLEIYAEVLKTLASWLSEKNPAQFLDGAMSQPVFRVR